jgi:hypothetical protein
MPRIVTAAAFESLEPEHRPDPVLYSPMVLFDDVIQVLARS